MSDTTTIGRRDEDPDGPAPDAPLRTGDDPDIAVEPAPEPAPDQRRAGFDPLHPGGGANHLNPFDRGSRSDLA